MRISFSLSTCLSLMASLAVSLLLLSLFVIVSANDYNYDSSKTQTYKYPTKPHEEEKPDQYSTNLTPKAEEIPDQPSPDAEENFDQYGTKPKPEPKDKENQGSVESEKPDYTTKPQPAKEENTEYEPKNKDNDQNRYSPDLYPSNPDLVPIGVQGLVLCKSASKYYAIQGALARITCLVVDKNGYEQTHSVSSGETDENGYFLAPLGLNHVTDQCKAFLESSPLETCNVPVDVNKGVTGAPLSDFRLLKHNNIKLYSVGPFFFTSQSDSVPTNNNNYNNNGNGKDGY